jgi:hypothetical protein
MNSVVAHPDGADFAFIVGINQSLPSSFASLSASVGSMNENEINVSKACFLQSPLYLSFGIVVAQSASRNFAGEENFFTFEPRVQDSFATWSFIAICSCRINLQSLVRALNSGVIKYGSASRVYSQL